MSSLVWMLSAQLLLAAPAPQAKTKAPAAKAEQKPEAKRAPPKKQGKRRKKASPKVFQEGLGAYYNDDFITASARMYDYLATNQDSAENYEWARFFLGASLKALGYSHGAVEYLFDVANDRTRPEILPEALSQLEELAEGPHDELLLDRRLIVDSDFGYLPPQTLGFVRYYQGLADIRDGQVTWATKLFKEIPESSKYYPKAIYALGVQALRRNKLSEAVKKFRAALAHGKTDRLLRNQARLALARVLYEKEAYPQALELYKQVEVPKLSLSEASLFLEKAWTHYWLGNLRKTMGLLYALEAPSYRDYFAPEKFLLRSLVYKNYCHYIPSKREIRRFRFRLGPTLENIRRRIDLREDDVLRGAAVQAGHTQRIFDFRRRLENEANQIDTIGGDWSEVGLDDHLRKLYRLKSAQLDLKLDAELTSTARGVAENLIAFEEQMDLLDYEVGLSIYRRLRQESARRADREAPPEIPLGGPDVYYPFVQEFWNDEIYKYDFLIDNRCFDEGGER